MSAHVFSEIYLHYNWHTDGDSPILTPEIEAFTHNFIRNKCKTTKGVFFERVGGTQTHIHLAVRVEPSIAPSEFIGDLKGSSSFETNKHLGRKVLNWQRGYGVVSFSHKQLPWISNYIDNQKQRHADGKTIIKLEETKDNDEPEQQPESPAEAG